MILLSIYETKYKLYPQGLKTFTYNSKLFSYKYIRFFFFGFFFHISFIFLRNAEIPYVSELKVLKFICQVLSWFKYVCIYVIQTFFKLQIYFYLTLGTLVILFCFFFCSIMSCVLLYSSFVSNFSFFTVSNLIRIV